MSDRAFTRVTGPPTIPSVAVPAGRFLRGASLHDKFANSTERPATWCEVAPFVMMVFPVTETLLAAWRGGPAGDLPAVRVSWLQASAFAEWLSRKTGNPWRLPTETEWEWACRAGTTTPYHTGDALPPSAANYLYDECGRRVGRGCRTPPGTHAPNAFGLEDMHGNVLEWCADPWRPRYDAAPDESQRIVRGGAWDLLPRLLRASWRDGLPLETRRDHLGFRLVHSLPSA